MTNSKNENNCRLNR